MAFLAHWKIGGAPGDAMNGQAAVDSAAGGSGAHDGTYVLNALGGSLLKGFGTDEGLHLQASSYWNYGYIHNMANVADLRLQGLMTVAAWFRKLDNYAVESGLYLANCGGSAGTQAENRQWTLEARAGGGLRMLWENGVGVNVDVQSISGILPVRTRWVHVAAVRYEVTPGFYGVRFYVDGVLADTQDNTGSGWAPPDGGGSSPVYIGRWAGGQPARGFAVDSVRLYDSDEGANLAAIVAAEAPAFQPVGQDVSPSLRLDGQGSQIVGGRDLDPSLTLTGQGHHLGRMVYTGERSGRPNAGFHQ